MINPLLIKTSRIFEVALLDSSWYLKTYYHKGERDTQSKDLENSKESHNKGPYNKLLPQVRDASMALLELDALWGQQLDRAFLRWSGIGELDSTGTL